jgi:hypothetical protein
VLWLTVGTIAFPFVLGLCALVLKSKAKALEDARLEVVRASNQALAKNLDASRNKVAELEQRTGPWKLSTDQRGHILNALAKLTPARALVICRLMDGDSCDLAQDLIDLFKELRWEVTGPGSNSLNPFFGVDVIATGSGSQIGANALLAALSTAGIQTLSEAVPPGSLGGPLPPETVCVIVGRRLR